MKKLFLIFSFMLFIHTKISCMINIFDSISEINSYADKMPEYPKIDNKNWLKPDYSTFYKNSAPNKLQVIISNLYNKITFKKQNWDYENFKKLLESITTQRLNNKLNIQNYVIKISPTKDANFIIFTELGGAFHSLARSLNELIKLNFLDDNLNIKQNNFIVFNGNILGNSPYILETLTLILKIMEKNPQKVFFIKGKYELDDNWQNFGLKKELIVKSNTNILGFIPLEKETTTFLNTLPLAVYIKLNDKKNEFIRVSYFNRSFHLINESILGDFLNTKQINDIDIFDLSNKKENNTQLNIVAILNGDNNNFIKYKKTDGIIELYPDKGANSWSLISGPSSYAQEIFNFKNDAFVILNCAQNIINVYFKDSYIPKEFNTKKISMLTQKSKIDTAEMLTKQSDQNEIRFGTTMDFSSSLANISRDVLKGLHLVIKKINNMGGINNKKIKLVHLDDKYDPQMAAKNIQLLIDSGIDKLLCPVGSYQFKGYLDFVKNGKIAVYLPEITSQEYRNKELKNIVHLFATSNREAHVLTNYLLQKFSPNKIAIFYEEETFSKKAAEKIINILIKNNLIKNKNWIEATHLPKSIDVKSAAKKIIDFEPEAIFLLSSEFAIQNLINNLGMEFLFNKTILGISACSNTAFKTFLKEKNLKFMNTQLTPNPTDSSMELVKNFITDATNAGEPLSNFMLEGYMAASIFFDIIKDIQDPITNEKIMAKMENIKNQDYKGLILNFNPETREIANTVWLDIGEEVIMKND